MQSRLLIFSTLGFCALIVVAVSKNDKHNVLFVGDSQCEFLGGVFYSAVAQQTAARLKLLLPKSVVQMAFDCKGVRRVNRCWGLCGARPETTFTPAIDCCNFSVATTPTPVYPERWKHVCLDHYQLGWCERAKRGTSIVEEACQRDPSIRAVAFMLGAVNPPVLSLH